jgi:ribonuclease-3
MVDKAKLSMLEARLSYGFKDQTWLALALTPAATVPHKRLESNERLEFLGDRVLGLVIADYLYHAFPHEEEGMLAKRHSRLVEKKRLVQIAQRLELLAFLPPLDQHSSRDTILADALEALIAALYGDGGLEAARHFILSAWGDDLTKDHLPEIDAKTALQEWALARGLPLPSYTIISQTGASHAPFFKAEVAVKGYTSYQGEGHSKQEAHKNAAHAFLNDHRSKEE